MAWVELLETHSGSLDSFGKGVVYRRFKCWNGVTVAQILQDPGSISNDDGEFLPIIGAAHPDYIDQSMVLDHYECVTESITVIAAAVYSNVLGGGSIKYNPDKRIGTSYERRNVELWYGKSVLLEVAPNDPEPLSRWKLVPATVIENFMRLTYRTIVPKKDPYDPNKPCWDGKTMELIRAAIGELHRFGFDGAPPVWWQFSGADPADRNLEEAVTVTYSWIMDPGTVEFGITHPYADPNDSFYRPEREHEDGFGNLFVRPPFAKIVPAINRYTKEPLFFPIYTSVKNENGWKNLPGLLP